MTCRITGRHAALIATAFALTACGPQGGGGTGMSFAETLNFLRTHGLPKLDELMPGLPGLFSRVEGVATSASGLPSLPSNLEGSVISGASEEFTALAGEATELSAQGFSEARRIEALTHNVLAPVFDLVSQSSVFQQTAAAVDPATGAMLVDLSGDPVTNIFDALTSNLQFAVDLGKSPTLPSYLVFSAENGQRSISVSGLWPSATGESLQTGFLTELEITSLEDFAIRFVVRPGMAGGLVKAWQENSCDDDLFAIEIGAEAGVKSATLRTLECPENRNALASLGLAFQEEAFTIKGAFSQNFASPSSESLRAWLGERQGIVLQASASHALDKVAAAAAVLRQSQFGEASQDAVDRFGVAQIMTDFLLAKYWAPKRQSAKAGILSQSGNPAYWLCESIVKSSLQSHVSGGSSLCRGESFEAEGLITSLTSLEEELADSPAPDSVVRPIASALEVLAIRNPIFLAGEQPTYKTTDDETLKSLDATRAEVGVLTLDDLDWVGSSRVELKSYLPTEIPTVSFTGIGDAIGSFLSGRCRALLGNAQEKAGKSSDGSACS